jgi:hypothetical protein
MLFAPQQRNTTRARKQHGNHHRAQSTIITTQAHTDNTNRCANKSPTQQSMSPKRVLIMFVCDVRFAHPHSALLKEATRTRAEGGNQRVWS